MSSLEAEQQKPGLHLHGNKFLAADSLMSIRPPGWIYTKKKKKKWSSWMNEESRPRRKQIGEMEFIAWSKKERKKERENKLAAFATVHWASGNLHLCNRPPSLCNLLFWTSNSLLPLPLLWPPTRSSNHPPARPLEAAHTSSKFPLYSARNWSLLP